MKMVYGIGILLFLIFIFFLPPILKTNKIYAPVDEIYMVKPWNEESHIIPENYQQGDALVQFIPWRRFTYDQMHKGKFPLWSPYSYGGMPFFANDQSAVLSIYNLLSLPFSFEKGFLVIAILKLIITSIGMYLLLDLFSLNIYACLLGSIAWTFSAFMITFLFHPISAAGSFIPWFFYWFERFIRSIRQNKRYTLLELFGLSTSIGLSFLSGHAETTTNGLIGLAVYGITRILLEKRCILKTMFYTGFGVIAGFLLAAIQLFPFIQVLLNSEPFWYRAHLQFGGLHLPLYALASEIVPNILGNPSFKYFFNSQHIGFHELVNYVGIASLMLGIYAIRFSKDTYKITIPFIIMLIISISFTYGIPPLSLLTVLPVLKSGASARYIILLEFGLSVLAGFGMDRLSRVQGANTGKKYILLIGITLFTSVIAIFLYYITRQHIDGVIPIVSHIPMPQNWFGVRLNPERFGFIIIQILIAFIFILTVGFLILKHKTHAKIGGVCLLILSVLDLFIFGITYNPDPPAKMLNPETPIISKLLSLNSNDHTFYAGGYNIILPNISMNYGLRDFRGYDMIVSIRYQQFLSVLLPGSLLTLGLYGSSELWPNLPDPVITSIAGIKYIITDASNTPEHTYYRFIGTYNDLSLWENPYAKSLIYLASNVKSVSDEQALELLSTYSPQLLNTTLVTGIDTEGSIDTNKIQIIRTKDLPGEHVIGINAQANGFLVINEPYYPGWHGYINNREVPVYHTNYLFQGIKLPEGNYRVVFIYKPEMFYFGMTISILAIIFMLGISGLSIILKKQLPRNKI